MKFKYLLLSCVLMYSLNSCKKQQSAPAPGQLILGKWYLTIQVSTLYHDSTVLDTFSKTSFTNNDFVEYYKDGSGYHSISTTAGPSLSEFTYSVSGSTITEFTNSVSGGQPETIKNITSDNFSLHVERKVADPNDPSVTDTEIDNLTYSRQL